MATKKGELKTSKALLFIAVFAGIVALFIGRLDNPYAAASFGVICAVLVWNRTDSRYTNYNFNIKAAGMEANINAKGAKKLEKQ
jgi:hypothetical protein